MKNREEILARARELVDAERERRFAEAQSRLPHLCIHNHRQALDDRREVDGAPNPFFNRVSAAGTTTIGLCLLGASNPEEWTGTICDDPSDAQRCPFFNTTQSKEEVLEIFRQSLAIPGWVNVHMPELAALLWVLDTEEPPRPSLWARFWWSVRRFKVEPQSPSINLEKLLSDSNLP